MKYYLYIIKTVDNTLYCGIALDVLKRFQEHLSSKRGAKYTKSHKPEAIVYVDCFNTKSEAMKEEYRIKKTLSKTQKEDLVREYSIRTQEFLKKIMENA